jgi:hypothetical protein
VGKKFFGRKREGRRGRIHGTVGIGVLDSSQEEGKEIV